MSVWPDAEYSRSGLVSQYTSVSAELKPAIAVLFDAEAALMKLPVVAVA